MEAAAGERVERGAKPRRLGEIVAEVGMSEIEIDAVEEGGELRREVGAHEIGGTGFQRRVWAALRSIPAGETLSYAGLAARIGKPTAMRAVGLANGANPVALVFPCHRVIGANGTLTGYGGGLHRKRWLLAHEEA